MPLEAIRRPVGACERPGQAHRCKLFDWAACAGCMQLLAVAGRPYTPGANKMTVVPWIGRPAIHQWPLCSSCKRAGVLCLTGSAACCELLCVLQLTGAVASLQLCKATADPGQLLRSCYCG
jgi:hypothetical protein